MIVVVYAALVVAIVTATVVQAVYVHDVAVIAVSDGAIGVPDRPTAAGVADDFDVAVVAVAVPRAASASASASFETVGLAVGPYLLHYRLYRKQLQTEVHPRRPTRGPVSDQSQHF